MFRKMGENMMRISSFILMITSLSVTSLIQGYSPRSGLASKRYASVESSGYSKEYLDEYNSANMAQVYMH